MYVETLDYIVKYKDVLDRTTEKREEEQREEGWDQEKLKRGNGQNESHLCSCVSIACIFFIVQFLRENEFLHAL